ncbi:velvet factor [Umbelopsis sp. AD052]|nr:velvet factor [Umbelopsis sp. AD052]
MPERNPASFKYVNDIPYQPEKFSQFNLNIRQQPEQARLSTGNERERRTIEPPPIVQISLNGVSPENEGNWLQSPNYFMCANLVHPTNDSKVYTPHHPALAGQVVSAMYKLKDIDNQDGAYCVFGDLSVKAEGEFRLKFTLFKIQDAKVINIISIISSSFMTYAAKAYPGAMEPTFLSRSFYDQGARIRIRKENSLHV